MKQTILIEGHNSNRKTLQCYIALLPKFMFYYRNATFFSVVLFTYNSTVFFKLEMGLGPLKFKGKKNIWEKIKVARNKKKSDKMSLMTLPVLNLVLVFKQRHYLGISTKTSLLGSQA